jgi:hypothetical protein
MTGFDFGSITRHGMDFDMTFMIQASIILRKLQSPLLFSENSNPLCLDSSLTVVAQYLSHCSYHSQDNLLDSI